MMKRYPDACKDRQGRLRVGAAVGVHDFERCASLIEKDVDVLIVDSAHGHSRNVVETVREIKRQWDIDVIAGNVATAAGCRDMIQARGGCRESGDRSGFDLHHACGLWSGRATGHGRDGMCRGREGHRNAPDCRWWNSLFGRPREGVGRQPHTVMIGGIFAGLAESPGEQIIYQGRAFKVYRGMGSLGAMVHGSQDRYQQGGVTDRGKLVPEGVEGRVPFKGPLGAVGLPVGGRTASRDGLLRHANDERIAYGNTIRPSLVSERQREPSA